jgi:glycosyltransferase involved in cell wall biosynthesis
MSAVNFVIYKLGYGGAERVFKTLLKSISNVDVVVYQKKQFLNPSQTEEINNIHYVEYNSFVNLMIKLIPLKRVLFFGYSLGTLSIIISKILFIRRSKRLILRHTTYYSKSSPSLSFEYGFLKGIIYYIFFYFHMRFISEYDLHVAQNESMKENLIEVFSISSNKIKVILNPVDSSFFKSMPLATEVYTISFVGRLIKLKGIKDLMQIIDKLDFNCVFNIIGDGAMKKDLVSWVPTSNPLVDVRIIDSNDRIHDYYASSNLVVLPSYEEGSPNVLLEALAVGIPVVAYDCKTGPSEIIQQGVNGYLISLGNIAEFVSKIKQALEQEWDVNVLKNSVVHHRADIVAKQYLDLFVEENS